MGMTAAEKQRSYREKRRNGEIAEKKIAFMVPVAVADRLNALAVARKLTQKDMLTVLVMGAK